MKKIHFYLRKSNSAKRTIYLVVRQGKNQSYRKSLPFQVNPQCWDKKTMRLKENSKQKDTAIINKYLNDIEQQMEHYFGELILQKKKISLNAVREFVYDYVSATPNVMTLSKYSLMYYKSTNKRISSTTGKNLVKSTQEKFRILHELITEYYKTNDDKQDLDSLDIVFFHSFIGFLQSKGYANSTIGKYIRALKTMLNEALAMGLTKNACFKSNQFGVFSQESRNIYLTRKDIEKIKKVKLDKSLDNARKMFLMGCFTGLRYSDFSRITRNNISEGFIYITQKKTGHEVVIPVHKSIRSIVENIDKINHISNTQLNKDIKKICLKAGLREKIVKQTIKAGKLECRVFEKWQLVCTHTARRSFATNLYLDGVPAITIMQITGHRSQLSFLKYIKISAQQNADILMKYWRKKK